MNLLKTEAQRRQSIINNTAGVIQLNLNHLANKNERSNLESISNSGNISGGKLAIEMLKRHGK